MMINFGTGGAPLTSKNTKPMTAISRLKELGLNHMEFEFVYSVFVKEEIAAEIKDHAAKNNVTLTVHGSYYTNFASPDDSKWNASIDRLVKAAYIGDIAGAKSITFHSGFFTGQTEPVVQERIKLGLYESIQRLESEGVVEIVIAPELTGKASQFGSIKQLISLIKQFRNDYADRKSVFPRLKLCIDFAHKHARNVGIFNTETEYRELFDLMASELGEEILKELHMHFSAINYGPKGERNHLTLLPKFEAYQDYGVDLPEIEGHYAELKEKEKMGPDEQDWKGLLKVLKEFKVGGYLVCESPNLEHDALLLQKVYREL